MPNLLIMTMVAVAVASDAFSVSLGVGTTKTLRLQRIGKIALLIGAFHVIMPLIGIYLGSFLAGFLEEIGDFIAGAILIFLGYKMIVQYQEGQDKASKFDLTRGTGLLVFAVTVSIDALTVGLTLGLAGAASILIALIFGGIAFIMTAVGLLLGGQLTKYIKNKGELVGGVLLVIMGAYFILF
ncbi:manganese efflux pump MntP family protein [Natranaerofaba carboxydovora]|uniref:manganese efflux pump MntP n=1 Tax=Natranaerofaba carboxydovora TaxID=2742683 RepID=UPI001F130476|nr:manganese efflux pump MntP family protein [Natranaerofaba carboxydovora]UMZ75273.1 putative manganese efflux pump MntP [Natranaerofaba carboxydovora]